MHTNEYLKLFSADGGARAAFKKASPGAEAWVDEFCDGLVNILSIQQKFEALPPASVNLWMLVGEGRDTTKWQVNVDIGKQGSWSIKTGDDLLANLAYLLNLKHR